MNKESLKGHSELIILSALAKQPMHGYALSEHIKDEMAEAFKFGVGMLYPLLHKLEQEKLIQGEWQSFGGASRRVYSLTKKGQKSLASKKREWAKFTSTINSFVNPATAPAPSFRGNRPRNLQVANGFWRPLALARGDSDGAEN